MQAALSTSGVGVGVPSEGSVDIVVVRTVTEDNCGDWVAVLWCVVRGQREAPRFRGTVQAGLGVKSAHTVHTT